MQKDKFILVRISNNIQNNFISNSNQNFFDTELEMNNWILTNMVYNGCDSIMFKGSISEWQKILEKECYSV